MLSKVSSCVCNDLIIQSFFLFFDPLCLPCTSEKPLFQSLFLQNPIIFEIKFEPFPHKKVSKIRDELLIVRFLIKLQLSCIAEKLSKFFRVTLSQILNAGHSFFYLDLFIFFFFGLCWETLPGQTSSYKVHQYDPNLLQIISSRLFNTQMCIQTCIACSPCQRLVIFKRDMSSSFWILISFGKSKVNQIQYMLIFPCTNQEIIWFDISMKEAILMHEFYSLQLYQTIL